MRRGLLLIILLVSILSLSYAQIGDVNKEDLIKEVVELSGTKELSKYILTNALTQFRYGMSPEDYAKFEKEMVESEETKFDKMAEYLKEHFDQERFSAVLQWLRSPLSKKMTQLYVQAFSPEAVQETNNFAFYLQSNPPTKERSALVQKCFAEDGGSPCRLVPEIGLTLYIFRSVSDDELKGHLDFWTSETGKWFSEIMDEAMLDIDEVVQEEKEKDEKEIDNQEVSVPGLEGKVLKINRDYNFVVINLGSKDGIREGEIFSTYHNNKYIGNVKVETLHETSAAAGFLSNDIKNNISEGDKVVQKIK